MPEPAQPGGIAEAIRELDKRNAPDDEYRSLLSTASKDELKPGETWRERAMRVAESQQPQETPAPPATDLTRLNPDDLHAELLRRSRAAQDAEDAYAASHAGTVGAPETQAAANALDAAEAAHKEALAAYDKLPDQKFIVTTRHYQGKTKKFTDQENTFTGKTATEVMDEQKRGIEKYSRETGRRAEIVSIRPAEAAPASPPTPAPVTPEPPATPGTPEPPARRPVTEAEQNQLQANLNKARAALNKATRDRTIKPLVWNAAHQKVLDAQAALDNAEGPPTKPMFIKAPPGAMEAHAAAVKAHEAAITQRVHTEGTAPVPAPKEAGKIFTMGKAGGQDAQVVRLSDPAGNQWVGTGSAITRESVLGSAAAKIEKLKTSVTRTLPPEAFEQAIAVKPGVDRYPVTWERQVTDTDGKVMVIGTLPDGTHVTVQKPIYDTLHAAAGKDGTITAANSKNDQRVFAHDAKGELVGVGMPMNLKQDLARTYARGAEPKAPEPVAPVVKSTPAPAPVPVPEPVPAKAAEPAPAPAKRQNVKVTDLKAGDIVTTPEGQIKTLTRVTQTRKDKQVTIYVEGEKRPWISPPGRVWTVHPAPEPTELEARQGAVARPQRKSAPVPGAPAPLPKRIRTLKTPESTPAPQAGAPMTQEDISYSAGTPRYQEAFIRAMAGTGMDPRTAMNKPLDEQVTMVTRALQDKYGFGRVDIVADGGAQLKLTRDQLLNMHQNMQGMAHAMNWPNEVLSLNGRLNLKLVPRNFEGKHWMGMYSPATKTIHVSGGSNSYAHEHWHAIDEYLSDLLNTDPNKATLFSHAARHDQLDANKTTHTAFANVLNTLFYDQGELALRRLALERTAAKTVAGQPTKEALEAQEQIRKLDTGASKLRIPPSMFRASAAQMPDPAYYASAHELVARAGEAYTAWAMRNAGVRTEGVVKPDEGYQNQLLAYMKAAYPNAQDRTNIFKAFGDLRTELERASVLPLKGPGALPPSDQHTVPPTHARPAEIGPGLMARIKADLQAIKWSNLRGGDHESVVSPGEQVQPPRIYTGKNNAPVEQTRGVRLADTLGEHWLSPLGNMERWIEQIPPKARPAMTKLRDMLGHDPGSGRLIDQTFEERARHQAQKATARLEDIFRDAGLVHRVTKRTHLTRTDQQDLWHTLATGDTTYPLDAHDTNKTGQTRPIRSEIIEAAKKIRLDIFEKSYDTAKASGLPIGHTKEGYVPRVMNDAKILSDPQTFTKDIARINGIIQDNDFAASNEEPPVRLAKWWSDTEKRVRDSPAAFTDEQRAAMNELVKNLNRINAINAELAAGGAVNPNAHNPAALQAERDTLEARNQDIHDEHGQGVLDAVALNEAQNMTRRIITGKPQDFTTLGPRSEFLRQRTLPPEADQVLRNWYVSDPKVAIPMYIHSMSRKLAYHEVFGPSGNNVTALIHEAQAAGMHGDHVRKFQDVVETVTGRSTRQGNSADTRIFNAISAWGELITMSGATLSALAEPTAMVLHGGSFKQVLKVYSNLMGQFFGTMEGAERMRIARQIGAISSVLQGSAMANRATDYSGTPVMGAIVNNFFELAMSPAIRMIRAATIGPSWSLLKELLEVANAPAKTNHELNRKDDAQRLLRDFGIADHQVGMMHDWAQTVTGEQPAPEQITNTKEGQLWEVVENRVLDRLNVNPTAAEKPMGALKTSYGNMMLGLTSFVWGFFRNGVLPAFRKIGHAGHRQYERAKTNGATDRQAWFQAKGSQLQYSLMAAVAAATLTLGTGMVGTARTYIFNQDAWAKHAEAGDLLPWLFGNAVSQSGLNGPLDLIGQAYHSLRYTSDLSNLTSGPFLATELRYAVDVVAMVNDIVSGEAKTNTKFYNGVHALLQLAGKPGALIGLTWLMRRLPAGGPLSALVTAASIGGVSTSVTRGITDQIAGPRGTTLPDEPKPGALPRLPDLPELPPLTPGEAKGAQHQETAMTAAIGIADDILMPIIQALPGPLKTAAVGAAAVATMGAAYYRGAQFREQGEPPKKHH